MQSNEAIHYKDDSCLFVGKGSMNLRSSALICGLTFSLFSVVERPSWIIQDSGFRFPVFLLPGLSSKVFAWLRGYFTAKRQNALPQASAPVAGDKDAFFLRACQTALGRSY
ncbi:MAG: hypothetical protein ACPGGJ_00705 [Coraliomargarita sp.]